MDRILRPEGTAIIHDTVDVLTKVQAITKQMQWESCIMDHEDGPFNPEKILMAVKTYWTADASEQHLAQAISPSLSQNVLAASMMVS
jgi:hypothetical protein